MDKNKEILDLKKLYISNVEKWESRNYYLLFSFSLLLIVIAIKYKVTLVGVVGIVSLTSVMVFDLIFDWCRKEMYNNLKKEIELGKFEEIETITKLIRRKLRKNG